MGNLFEPDGWYTTDQVASALPGLTPASLAQMRCRGRGPAYVQYNPHGRVLYQGRDLLDWLDSGRKTPSARVPA